MYHTIEFAADLWVDLERNHTQPLERLRVQKGTKHRVRVRPFVVETRTGPIEVADLCLENGATIRDVPFAAFRFVE